MPFQASVWRRSKFKELSSITEQVWFSGAHADVGGGYYADGQRVDDRIKLDGISLDWMLKRVNSRFPGFPLHLTEHWKVIADSEVTAEHHNPRRNIYRAFPYALRSIGNYPSNAIRRKFEKEVCLDRHSEPIGEMIYISVLQRLGTPVWHDKIMKVYSPQNVLSVLDIIEASYGAAKFRKSTNPILIVDWDGLPLATVGGRDKGLGTISAARERLRKPYDVRRPWLTV